MAELNHLGYYTRELKKHLPRRYFQPVPSRLLWLIPQFAAVISSWVALDRLELPFWGRLGVALVIGFAFTALGFLGHEVLHGSVVRTPWLRDLVGGICFAQFNLGPKLWRRWHNVEHHGHTQFEEDPDAMGTLESYRERPALRALYSLAPSLRSLLTFVSFTFWFSFHSLLMLFRYCPTFERKDRMIALAQFALPGAGWTGLLLWLGPADFLFGYLLPVMVANFVVMSYIATNHLLNPLTPVNDPLANSLSVIKPRFLDVLHLNFSYHTEHHLFPSMNPKYAPKVKEAVLRLWPDRYHAMPHWKALRALWRTPRLYRDHGELIDPKRDTVFPVLGRGLDPDDIRSKTAESR